MMKTENIEKRMREIESLLKKMSIAYYQSEHPIAPDSEYDKLYDELVTLEKKYPNLKNPLSPTVQVQSDISDFLKEVPHTVPVLSLDKAYSTDELIAFTKRCEKECKKEVSFTLEEKIDGLSLVIYYKDGKLDRALTRGNGHIGGDVTFSALKIPSIPKVLTAKINIAVRGEVYITKDAFKKINETLSEPYSNARNLASGLLRRQDDSYKNELPLSIFVYEGWADELSKIDEHPKMLSYLKELGFRTNEHIIEFGKNANSLDTLSSFVEQKTKERKTLPYEIDGLVLKLNNLKDREVLGYTEHHPRWAIAYKFESPMGKSKVVDIEIGVGRTGRITPVAILSPVNLLGATITRATLHNSDYINELELSIGDEVSVSRRGDVIPQIDEVLEKNENASLYTLPSTCPVCKSTLEYKGVNLYCLNPKCKARIKGEIEYFVSKTCMDMDGIGPSVIQTLLDLNAINDYTDLYYIDYDNVLTGKEGFKEKKIATIKDAVEKSKKQPFTRVLASLGIEGIALNTAEKLVNAGLNSFDSFIKVANENDVSSLTKIDEIGEITAENIINAFIDKTTLERIEKLKNAGLKTESDANENKPISDVLLGQVWCVTGSIEGYKNPDLAMDEVKKRGARVVSSVSRKTTHLLVGTAPGSKLDKAINFGTTIVKDIDFQEFLKNADSSTPSSNNTNNSANNSTNNSIENSTIEDSKNE